MRRFLRPFRPVLGSVFEYFSFFFTQKNSRFLSFFAVFCHIFRKNPALFFKNPALFRQNPALFHQNPALIYSTFIAASRIRIACKVTKHSAQSSQFVGKSARFNAIAPGSLAFHRRIPKASSPVDHLFRKSEGVTPKCFLNWRVKCCG